MKTSLALTLLSFFFTTSVCLAESTNATIQQKDTVNRSKLIRQISKENTYILRNEENTNQLKNYRRFSQSGTTYDFLKIAMENENPIIRIYAFRAVAERMDNLPSELVNKFKSDTTLVKANDGTRTKEITVSEIINGFLK